MAADSNSPYIMDRPMGDNKIIFDFFFAIAPYPFLMVKKGIPDGKQANAITGIPGN